MHPGDESAAVPVHAVHAGHVGQVPWQGRAKGNDPSATPVVSTSRDAACHDCAVARPCGGDELLCSIEEQSGDIHKVM